MTAVPETKHDTYTVLKQGASAIDGVTWWLEVGELTGEGPYGYHPTADDFGSRWGAGTYLYIEQNEGSSFKTALFIDVVGETVWRELDASAFWKGE